MKRQLLVARALLSCAVAHGQCLPGATGAPGDPAACDRDTAKWCAQEGCSGFECRGAVPSRCSQLWVGGGGLSRQRFGAGEVLAPEAK
jgi:hypothetical protein